eukprot:gene19359-23147_t
MSTDEFCCRIKKGSQQFPFEYKESNCGCHHPNQEYGIGMMADLMIWYLRSSMSHVKMAATLLQNADPAAGATWQERMMHTIQHGTASVSEEVPDGCGAEPYYSSGADFLERLGTYYDLPVISVRDALWAVARRSYFRQDSTRMAPE